MAHGLSPKQQAMKVIRNERVPLVLAYRKQALPIHDIVERLLSEHGIDVSRETVRRDIIFGLSELTEEREELASDLLSLLIERLEHASKLLFERLQSGDVKVFQEYRRQIETLAKLTGHWQTNETIQHITPIYIQNAPRLDVHVHNDNDEHAPDRSEPMTITQNDFP